MRVLCVGDVVGSPGRRIFKAKVKELKDSGAVHAVIVNAENAAAGKGITDAIAEELFAAGADLITLGDHTWDQKTSYALIDKDKRIVRPANMPEGCLGKGWATIQTSLGAVTVISLMGRTFMNPADCPFKKVDELIDKTIPRGSAVIVDFHAEATSEKICMGWHLDGKVATVFGTHTHVQTSDAKILPKGTGYITDLGMTGPINSVIGREIAPVEKRFMTGMPSFFSVAEGPAVLEGCIFDIDRASGKTTAVQAVRYFEEQ